MNRKTWNSTLWRKEINLNDSESQTNQKSRVSFGTKYPNKTKLKSYLNKQSKPNTIEKYNPSKTVVNASKYLTKNSGANNGNRKKPLKNKVKLDVTKKI